MNSYSLLETLCDIMAGAGAVQPYRTGSDGHIRWVNLHTSFGFWGPQLSYLWSGGSRGVRVKDVIHGLPIRHPHGRLPTNGIFENETKTKQKALLFLSLWIFNSDKKNWSYPFYIFWRILEISTLSVTILHWYHLVSSLFFPRELSLRTEVTTWLTLVAPISSAAPGTE